jgi:glycerophosphoryl diester phosphodiesterase
VHVPAAPAALHPEPAVIGPAALPGSALVIGHRGASGLAPENTLPALQLAHDLGAEGVEVDVQRTSDGVLVLVHDADWRRTTGHPGEVRRTPWATVRGLDAGGWFGAAYRGVAPPRLEEVLAFARDRMLLNVEIKAPERDPGLAEAVVAAIRRHRAEAQVLLTSFDPVCIDALAEASPDLGFGYISERAVERMHPRVTTLSLGAELLGQRPELVASAHAQGRRVLAWTVDTPEAALRLAAAGVDGILTNHPERLRPHFPRLPRR